MKYFYRYFEIEITDGNFPSVIQSVITDGKVSEFKKKVGLMFPTARTVPVQWCNRFAV